MKAHIKRRWTLKEIRFLEEQYGKLSVGEIAKRLNRTVLSVGCMAHKLGCTGAYQFWTEEDEKVPLTYYAAGEDIKTIMMRLPGRSAGSIRTRAESLGILRWRWKPEETRIIRQYYPSEGSKVVERLPGRTVSAIANRAQELGLKYCGKNSKRKWTVEEFTILEQHLDLPITELVLLLPERTVMSIRHVRSRLLKQRNK